MYRACSRCGRIHKSGEKCPNSRTTYKSTQERKLRESYDWRQKSIEIREKAQYLCELCRKENRYTYELLEVHHIVPLKDAPDRLLDNYNLICLCAEHHKKAERGEISREVLETIARAREEGIPPVI